MWASITSLHSRNDPEMVKPLLLAVAASLLRQILARTPRFQYPRLRALPVLRQIPQDLTVYLLQLLLLLFLGANNDKFSCANFAPFCWRPAFPCKEDKGTKQPPYCSVHLNMMSSSFFTMIGSYLLQNVRRENHGAKVEIFTHYSRRVRAQVRHI